MIYSRWKPDVGGYDYFDDGVPHNINDDLPTPDLPGGTEIGVPSVEAGRPIPANAVWVGEGPWAVGVVAPIDPSRIQRRTRSLAGGELMAGANLVGLAALGLGAAVGYGIYRAWRRRR